MKRMMIALLLLVCLVFVQGSVYAHSLAYSTGTVALSDGDDGDMPSDGDGGDSSSGSEANE